MRIYDGGSCWRIKITKKSNFIRSSFKFVTVNRNGIGVMIGKKKETDKFNIRSIDFDKKKWTKFDIKQLIALFLIIKDK